MHNQLPKNGGEHQMITFTFTTGLMKPNNTPVTGLTEHYAIILPVFNGLLKNLGM
jgi:hypothetical protein